VDDGHNGGIAGDMSLKLHLHQRSGFAGIVGNSPAMLATYELIHKVAATNSTVLITGESGTGKELIARVIHEKSSRVANPFIVAHCGTIPYELLESELFGHKRGAFTSAYEQKLGLFQIAHTGTIFLDEAGEISPYHQVKLLRVLEAGMMRPVGAVEDVKVDVRVIAATNRDLAQLVKERSFREDLFYRLNVFPIRVPPLRERGGDIVLLARHFLQKYRHDDRPAAELTPEAEQMLLSYSWPGNVRELENVIERATILCMGGLVGAEVLPPEIRAASGPDGRPASVYDMPFKQAKAEFEREYVRRRLRRAEGNVAKAAVDAGMSRAYFYEMLKKREVGR
jgi:transcriptional regulator with GAF, ATPase, and Fis domain